MLRELDVSQKEEKNFRRWFQDEYFELIVWYDLKSMTIRGFQLCYDIRGDEHCFTWITDKGVMHNRVDEGDRPFRYAATPVLVADGHFPARAVLERFKESCTAIDPHISRIVINKIIEFEKVAD